LVVNPNKKENSSNQISKAKGKFVLMQLLNSWLRRQLCECLSFGSFRKRRCP